MKILVVRFSSIGDIVLTTPVVRCIKQQVKGVELHYLTKKTFGSIVQNNPYLDKVYSIEKEIDEVLKELKKEKYDLVIDLHHNLRTLTLKLKLGVKTFSFNKLNYAKWLKVNLKINALPNVHIVDRYFETLETLGVKNDNQGLDYFIPIPDQVNTTALHPSLAKGFYALVVGGSYFTKQIPVDKLIAICDLADKPVVLLGGKADRALAEKVAELSKGNVINTCGDLRLDQSASLVQQADKVITSDTGLMHIASAFKKDIVSIWGNTIPEFGMYPYLPGPNSKILEVKGLFCRPCSKLGYRKCPKGHFKCMMQIEVKEAFNS
ncbi:MAG: glycosyltransferase family 9 protein [Bacteroidia bacterium]